MKICILTGIFPPEIGGPAIYAQRLARGLVEKGIGVKMVIYSSQKSEILEPYPIIKISKRYPRPIQYFLCWINLLRLARDADAIYTFGITTAGLPPLLVSKILRKKFIIRLGGDFLWERATERGEIKKSLREFYEIGPKSFKEKASFYLIKRILNQADKIVFTTNFQKEIYKKYLSVQEKKVVVISNPFPEIEFSDRQLPITGYQLLYAGRLMKLKNLDTLIEIFGRVIKQTKKPLTLKIIGQGPEIINLKLQVSSLKLKEKIFFIKPLFHQDLIREIQKSYLCVLPSLTEVSPNLALECIKLRKPILLTKETGIYEDFKNHLIFIDPQDRKDIEEKILYLLDKKNYQKYIDKIKNVPTNYSWDDVIKKHVSIFKELKKT